MHSLNNHRYLLSSVISGKRKSLDKVVVQAEQYEVENMINSEFKNKISYNSSIMDMKKQINNNNFFNQKRSVNSSLSFLKSITSS